MATLPGVRIELEEPFFAQDAEGRPAAMAGPGSDATANDNEANDLDVTSASEQLERIKQSALQARDEPERVRLIDDADALFGRLPAAQIDEAQVQDWRRSWVQDFAESHIRMLAPQQAIDLLQPRAVPQQSAQTNSLEVPAQPAPETQANSSFGDFLPDERKSVLLQDARHRHALERVSAAIERGNMLERQISEAAERGDFSALPLEKTIAEAADLSPFERNNLLALHRKAAGDLTTLHRAMERFADPGSRPFDPFDAKDRAEVDALYRKLGANPEALSAVFRRTGLVPQPAVTSFRDELASNEPARVQAVAETLSGMLDRNPDALAGVVGSSELEDTALAYRHLIDARGLNKEAAGAALIEMRAAGDGGIDHDAVERAHELSGARRGRQGPGFGEAAGLGGLIVKLFEKYFGKTADPDATLGERPAKPDLLQSETKPELKSEAPPSEIVPRDTQPPLTVSDKSDVGIKDSGRRPIAQGAERYATIGNRQFVRHADGSLDFGEIPTDIAVTIGMEPGPIRLPKGTENKPGELHMIRGGKINELRRAGYSDVGELVDDVGRSFNEIWRGTRDTLILVKRENGSQLPTVFVELSGAPNARYWEVKSGGIYRAQYTQGKQLLWHGERTPTTAAGEQVPSYKSTPGKTGGGDSNASDQSNN